MSDVDDFEFDELALDADALAALDAAEKQQLSAVEVDVNPPPNKRPRIQDVQASKPLRNTVAVRENVELPDDMELPELPVQDISSAAFSFNAHRRAQITATTAPAPTPIPPPVASARFPSRGRGIVQSIRQNVPSRSTGQYRPHFNRNAPSSSAVPTAQGMATHSTQQLNREQPTPVPTNQGSDERDRRLLELENLLKAETSKRMSRDGEITMLRKNLERAAQGSAASLAAAREEKEAAEAKILKMKKEMQDEMERLKTQYIFKQQEIGTSSRKPPMSTRPSRLSKEPSFPGWNASPSVSRIDITQDHRWQSTPKPAKVPDSPEKNRKSAMLPGFQNAFTEETPVRRQATPSNITLSPRKSLMEKLKESTASSPPVSPTATEVGNEDVLMEHYDPVENGEVTLSNQSANGTDDISTEESEGLDYSVDYPTELARIIISYTGVLGSSPVLQLLIEVSHDSKLPVNYAQSVTTLLQILGELPRRGYPACLPQLCRTLSSLFEQLAQAEMILQLTALLDAFTMMIASVPAFRLFLLNIQTNEQPTILFNLSKLMVSHMDHVDSSPGYDSFGIQAFTLLREMCGNITGDTDQLASICKQHHLFALFFDKSRPLWITHEGIRLLAMLASHHEICVYLIPSEDQVVGGSDNYLNRLSSLLIDLQDNSEIVQVKDLALRFFSELSLSSPETLRKLVQTSRLPPSLVFYITQLVTPLWEAEVTLMSNPSRIAESLRLLGDTLLLLYHLVIESQEEFDLRQCLHQAPHRPFNGIAHMFTVTFARLSYADPPSCFDDQQKQDVDALSDLARELLDLVVDGPESETVWNAFQDDPEDPGEMEEHLLGPDTDGLGG